MPVFLDQFTSEDPVIAALYDQMSKHWKPKKSRRKAAEAEGADEEVSAEEQGSSESLDSMEPLLEDAYSAGDEQEQARLASELGFTALVPSSPAGSLHTGITNDFAEKVAISSPGLCPPHLQDPNFQSRPAQHRIPSRSWIRRPRLPSPRVRRRPSRKRRHPARMRRCVGSAWNGCSSLASSGMIFLEGCMYACMRTGVW